MASSLIACVLLMLVTGVAADVCSYQLYPDQTDRSTYCSYGCCYTLIYPCCIEPIEPIYENAAFIAPVVIGSVGLFIGLVVVIVITVIRRKRLQTAGTVQYTTPGVGQQVITTNGVSPGVVTYPGYGNTQYVAHPMYPGQPANGTAPMYTVQGGPMPMYLNPAPSGPPPTYTSQNVEASAPGYLGQTNAPGYMTQTPAESLPPGGADPVPVKTPLQ